MKRSPLLFATIFSSFFGVLMVCSPVSCAAQGLLINHNFYIPPTTNYEHNWVIKIGDGKFGLRQYYVVPHSSQDVVNPQQTNGQRELYKTYTTVAAGKPILTIPLPVGLVLGIAVVLVSLIAWLLSATLYRVAFGELVDRGTKSSGNKPREFVKPA